VAHLPIATLPFLAAVTLEARRLPAGLDQQLRTALAAAGQGWANPVIDGRDVEIRGTAPGQAAAAAALAVVQQTPGVRRAEMRLRVSGPSVPAMLPFDLGHLLDFTGTLFVPRSHAVWMLAALGLGASVGLAHGWRARRGGRSGCGGGRDRRRLPAST